MDIQSYRNDTPGCLDHIHFNNAGASLPPQVVIETVKEYLDIEARIGGYEAMVMFQKKTQKVYHSLARMIHAKASEMAILQSATQAWYNAFYSMPIRAGQTVLCSEAEYGSNYMGLLRRKKEVDFNIKVIPSDNQGQIDLEILEKMISADIALIAITHIPTNSGLVNPAEEVGRIAQKNGIPYLLDACQSVGQLPLDISKLGCDFLAATGRKYLRAPRGTGFLYCREEMLSRTDPLQPDNWGGQWTSLQEYTLQAGAIRFENFEKSYALTLGLGAAAEYHLETDEEERYRYIRELADYARKNIPESGSFEIMDIGKEKCGIVTFRSTNGGAKAIQQHLSDHGIASSLTFPAGALIDSQKRGLNDLNRVSFHYYNTKKEIDQFLEVLKNWKY
ncbi:MAG: aminotransferase class V-fold PLP-dependent enzyme [Saprospiraceae bacterium]|nr:aminotransferase class V-fold PLP-dependent enzyme [Saprospiraceae bacterium]